MIWILEQLQKKMIKREIAYILGIVALAMLLFFNYKALIKSKQELRDQTELYNAVTSSLEVWKDKDSLNNAKIQIMQTEKAKDFLKLQNLEGANLDLKNLIEKQGKKIKDLSVALVIESESKVTDTLRVYYPIDDDTLIFSKNVLLDSVKNEWINVVYGFNKGFSYLDLSIRNKYEVVVGVEGKSIFKRGTPYATIKNLNPYTETKEMRVYQVAMPKPKTMGISLQAGFGGIYDIKSESLGYGPYIGLGVHYNIINW